MSSSHRRRAGVLAGLLVILGGLTGSSCQDSTGFTEDIAPPDSLTVSAVSVRAVRVEWPPVTDNNVSGYQLERRANLAGPFEILVPVVPQAAAPVRYYDTQVDPETNYGYRVRTISRLGGVSAATVVRGTKTPPRPGVLVRVSSTNPTPDAADADGYVLELRGVQEPVVRTVGPSGDVYFPALPVGQYTVAMRGVASYCDLQGDASRAVDVSDDGPNTVDTLAFTVVCRDPGRGRIVATVVATGDSLDANGYAVSMEGILDDNTLPESERVVRGRIPIPGTAGGAATFDNLRPGSYQVKLEDLAGNCVPNGEVQRDASVRPLSADTVRYVLSCEGTPPAVDNRPFKLVNAFTPQTGPVGSKVTLLVSVDLRADPAAAVSAGQSTMAFNRDALRFDSAGGEGGFEVTANGQTPGTLNWLAYTTSPNPPRGLVPLARFMFTVVGTAGARASTRNRETTIADANQNPYGDNVLGVVEDTFAVGSGGGGANQLPTVNAGGPYSGTAGGPIAFNPSASDPDGSIVSYAWTWGDGSSSTVTNAATTKTYSTAGSYTAIITVTDNGGGTATASVQVTVAPAGGGGGASSCGGTGLRFCSAWVPDAATTGQRVRLDLSADLSATPALRMRSAQSLVVYNPTVLRVDSVRPGETLTGPPQFQSNTTTPGEVRWNIFATNAGAGGVVRLARVYFTALGPGSVGSVNQDVIVGDAQDDAIVVVVVEDTLTITGGSSNQSPVALASVPATGTVNVAVSVSGSGSSDPDGSVAAYSWNWGDGSAASTGVTPSHTYASAGTYTVTLTVTDNLGATDTDTRTITVSPAAASTPFSWYYEFGAVSGDSIPMTIRLNLSTDITETPVAVETLQSFVVDSLKWNANVLQYKKTTWGPGGSGITLTLGATVGYLRIINGAVGAANATGVIQVATVWFTMVGPSGSSTPTQSFIGPLVGTPATGSYDYRPRTAVTEASFVRP